MKRFEELKETERITMQSKRNQMKKVILKSLTLSNWRGEKNRTTTFNDKVTTISGANGLGKSRHFDAFIWLLFGKDSQGRDNFEVKTRIDGEELHNVECSVVGVLDIDGGQITLKRELSEKWVKPRGQTEQVYKGNETLCWWNDVPVNVSDYKKRVEDIISEAAFKMLTNVRYFFELKWQDQRDILFQLAGVVSDEEIAARDKRFAELLNNLSGKSLTDFKRELAARKKRLKSELSEIQPRIDQTQKLMPEVSDFAALEAEMESVEAEIANVDKLISDVSERVRQDYESVQAKQSEINALKTKQQQVLFEAQSKAREEANNANSRRNELLSKVKALTAEIEDGSANIRRLYIKKADRNDEIKKLTSQADELRQDWYKENAAEYNGETTCPHCGQGMPEAMTEEAKQLFDKHKQARLTEITTKGKQIKDLIDESTLRVQTLEVDIVHDEDDLSKKKTDLEIRKKDLEGMKEVEQQDVIPGDIKEYADLTAQITALEGELKAQVDQPRTDSTDAYQEQKRELNAKRDELKAKLSDRVRIDQFTKQIAELEAKGKEIAQQIADAEKEEYTIAQFNKAKIDESEKRINNLFSLVTFKLFDYNIDDNKKENPIECCIPLVRGRYYASTNTADQINAGVDVINTLSRFHGVSAPIFIDGRESVNEIISTDSQVVNLVVTRDKELKVE